ncbi:hypothetical protein EHQ76_17865 [Leptospira barantonii]|uniref:Uncharacterized protein n=1 Tax=Leptospira barantonii TaxID=2023184 RepID=A0A5F2AYB4_9LEPT|nr:hypothetical protein [Leptospira barantonii]TGL93254.1 hypothetical protein EHQ76_17865 [Leptospira barantonii]
MAKKDLLKQAAGAHVRKTLGGESSPTEPLSSFTSSALSPSSLSTDTKETSAVEPQEQEMDSAETADQGPIGSIQTSSTTTDGDVSIRNLSSSEAREEKHLPKKNHLHRISSVMRLEDYTRPESPEREGSSRFLKIAGVILLALAIWFFWPAKHEIYMDIDKMTPEKVSGMSSQKEYHFSHGQDFFIYYKKGWSTPKRVRLTIYRTDGGKEEFSIQEKDFRKSFEKFQTYYDDTFFDQQGSYEVEIRDEDGELLVNKKFTID